MLFSALERFQCISQQMFILFLSPVPLLIVDPVARIEDDDGPRVSSTSDVISPMMAFKRSLSMLFGDSFEARSACADTCEKPCPDLFVRV